MTQKYPLPLTAAMLAPANTLADRPRYHGAGVATDWNGGVAGNDIDAATANVAIGKSDTAGVGTVYVPRFQTEKATMMVPLRTLTTDLGKDYGAYTGLTGRAGTIHPYQKYP
jgi:hypothetical protein